MKRVFALLLWLTAAGGLCAADAGQAKSGSDVTDSTQATDADALRPRLLAASSAMLEALQHEDARAIGAVAMPDVLLVQTGGTPEAAFGPEGIEPLRERETGCVAGAFHIVEPHARQTSPVSAVLTYGLQQERTCGGVAGVVEHAMTDNFILRNGTWRIAVHTLSSAR